MPDRVRIVQLSPADLAAYRELMLEAYALAPDAFTSTPEERAAEPDAWWLKRVADPTGLTAAFGAFVDGLLVGTVALEFNTKAKTRHKGQLIGMYVRPAARGTGAARQLLQEAIACASRRPGLELLTLTVTQGNAAAERLYASGGFRVFGVEPMAIRGNDGFLAKLHMWLELPRTTGRA